MSHLKYIFEKHCTCNSLALKYWFYSPCNCHFVEQTHNLSFSTTYASYGNPSIIVALESYTGLYSL